MLNRLVSDRWHEQAILRLIGGLRVDDLATAMVRDAETDAAGAGSAEDAKVYSGNPTIERLSRL